MRKLNTLLIIQLFVLNLLNAQTITSFSPKKGNPATLVTISGAGFNATAANNIVYFGTARGIVSSATANSISVFVPAGATYRPITVYNVVTRLTAVSKAFFTPTFSPKKNTITSNDFSGKVDFSAATATKLNSLAVGDFFLDGRLDVVSTVDLSTNTNSRTVFSFNNTSFNGAIDSTSLTASNSFVGGPRPQAVNFGDLDADGKLDFSSASYGGNYVFLQNSNLNAGIIQTVAFGPIDVVNADIDQDGKIDIVTANVFGLGISVLRNTNVNAGVFSFANSVDIVSGFQPVALAIGDIDGDGKEDVALANSNTDSTSGLTILRNTSTAGNISFAAAANFTTGPQARGIALADIDGDDKLDVIVANQKGNTICILRNTSTAGNISFAAKVNFTVANKPKSIAVGDLNGDGKVDVVVGNTKSNNVSVFQNQAVQGVIDPSSLATPFTLNTGAVPVAVAVADLDGDGRPDIETANYNASTISVIKNEPTGIGSPNFNVIGQSVEDRYAQFMQANEKNNLNANIYPNPAKNFTTLSFNRQEKPVAVQLTDMKGRVLWQAANVQTNLLQIPLNKLAPGMYFVSINGYLYNTTLKLVKQ